ncbi:10112_t:CDS:2 [Ambispora gerdemannii]|uniref:10112_t:CDS:1 n=1 Tax=Ambispora gerdemannii TaxID=144530 RepID=A0A9N8YXH8_9GLOM|nr:10112_t:CDS:2 [Ambispora gerdemannii]
MTPSYEFKELCISKIQDIYYQFRYIKTHTIGKSCGSINIDDITPIQLNFDPFVFHELNITSAGRFTTSEVQFYDNSNSQNVEIDLRLSSAKSSDISFKYETNGATKIINMHESKITWAFWDSNFYFKAKCGRARIDIHLPHLANATDLLFNLGFLDVKFFTFSDPSKVPKLNVITSSGDIKLLNASIDKLSLSTNKGGYVKGNFVSVQRNLSVVTTKGDVELNINTANGTAIQVNTMNGDVEIYLNNTFSGQYNISTSSGDLKTINPNITNVKNTDGTITSSLSRNASLFISTESGDIDVDFRGSKDYSSSAEESLQGTILVTLRNLFVIWIIMLIFG